MGNKQSSPQAQAQAAPLLSGDEKVDESKQKNEPPVVLQMSSEVAGGGNLTLGKQKELLDQALRELEKRLSERKHPYKLVVKFNADGTRASVTMKRGNVLILGWSFIVGACILGIILQRFLYPWFRWNMFVEVDKKGRIMMKFHNAKGRIALCLTCILTSCVLAYFSNEEYKNIRQTSFDAMQESTKVFSVKEGLGTNFPAIVDMSKENLKELFVGEDDSIDENNFLEAGMDNDHEDDVV